MPPELPPDGSDQSDQSDQSQAEQALLEWYIAVGADEAVGDAPINRLQAAAQTTAATPPQHTPPSATPRPSHSGSVDANAIAAACQTLEELRQAIETFPGCALKNTANKTVFADGVAGSSVMFIGEAPGREEDLQGLPFVGAAGQLLDRMLHAIGRDRTCVYISNILNWRPPGNRAPTVDEAMTMLPFIKRHIILAQPAVVVLLGGTSAKYLLDTTTGIMRLRGRWAEVSLDEGGAAHLPALPTLHPAYLLRQPAHKRLAWQDFLALKARLDEIEARA